MTEVFLGKQPAKIDTRTIKYASVRKPFTVLPPAPTTYDAEAAYSVDNTEGFMNTGADGVGDCVLAAAYHWLMVANKWETGQPSPIPTDAEILATYYHLTGGKDNGLVELDFLNYLRQTGIPIQGKLYKIYAFVSIDWKNHAELMDAMYYMKNLFVGLALPESALEIWNAGKQAPWVLTGKNDKPGSWGYHGVYNPFYLSADAAGIGLGFNTWGQRQLASWPWCDACIDEIYALVPAANIPNSPIDQDLLDQELASIVTDPSPNLSGTVKLSVTPSSASIAINGQTIPGQPSSFEINQGTYTIACSAKGYKTQKQLITVIAGDTSLVVFNLAKSKLCIFN
jgi:PEGA domain